MATIYSHESYVECKRLFVQRAMSPEAISELFQGTPSRATIYTWANQTDQDGKSWWQLRDEYREQLYQEASPNRIAQDFQAEMSALLAALREKRLRGALGVGDVTKAADAIGKLTKSIQTLTDARYQIPVMYSMLEDLVIYLHDHHDAVLSPDLINAIRRFKNLLRERIEA